MTPPAFLLAIACGVVYDGDDRWNTTTLIDPYTGEAWTKLSRSIQTDNGREYQSRMSRTPERDLPEDQAIQYLGGAK